MDCSNASVMEVPLGVYGGVAAAESVAVDGTDVEWDDASGGAAEEVGGGGDGIGCVWWEVSAAR